MFTYKEMSDVIAPMDGRDSKAASLITRFRNFRRNALISPIDQDREHDLEEHVFDLTEFCKTRILSTIADFGCDTKVLSKIASALAVRDVKAIEAKPNVLHQIPTDLERAIESVKAGAVCNMRVAIIGTTISVHMPWKREPDGPHITLPLNALLGPILNLTISES